MPCRLGTVCRDVQWCVKDAIWVVEAGETAVQVERVHWFHKWLVQCECRGAGEIAQVGETYQRDLQSSLSALVIFLSSFPQARTCGKLSGSAGNLV